MSVVKIDTISTVSATGESLLTVNVIITHNITMYVPQNDDVSTTECHAESPFNLANRESVSTLVTATCKLRVHPRLRIHACHMAGRGHHVMFLILM